MEFDSFPTQYHMLLLPFILAKNIKLTELLETLEVNVWPTSQKYCQLEILPKHLVSYTNVLRKMRTNYVLVMVHNLWKWNMSLSPNSDDHTTALQKPTSIWTLGSYSSQAWDSRQPMGAKCQQTGYHEAVAGSIKSWSINHIWSKS